MNVEYFWIIFFVDEKILLLWLLTSYAKIALVDLTKSKLDETEKVREENEQKNGEIHPTSEISLCITVNFARNFCVFETFVFD